MARIGRMRVAPSLLDGLLGSAYVGAVMSPRSDMLVRAARRRLPAAQVAVHEELAQLFIGAIEALIA
jgi:hypothetical protein